MTSLVGIDIGTMSTKSALVDAGGAPQPQIREYRVITDHTVNEDGLGEKVKTEPNPEHVSLYDAY